MKLADGWHLKAIAEIGKVVTGSTPSTSDPNMYGGDIPFVTPGDLGVRRDIATSERTLSIKGAANARVVPAGSTLVTCIGSTIGKSGFAATALATNQQINAVIPDPSHEPAFVYYQLEALAETFRLLAGTQAVPLLNKSAFSSVKITIPSSKSEQRSIAAILSTWDQAIVTAERVVANSQRQRLGLTQTLISDRSRQSRGETVLRREHASEIFLPRSVRRNGGLELLSVMQDVGVVPRSSLDRKVVMPDGSTDGYKLVEPGDFVISLRSFQGGLEYSRYRGLVSPAYTVLMPTKPIVDDFYRHYFKSQEFIGRLAVAVIGIRDGKQISYDDFEFIKLPYPSIAEQEAIANTLNAAEQVVKRHETYLQLLRQEKAALMSQLLTGKRRVKLPDAETEVQA